MLIVSLHGFKLHAKVGLYPEEKITGNDFEIDVDVFTAVDHAAAFPFIDYAVIGSIIAKAFEEEGDLLETFVKKIHRSVKDTFTEADKVRVVIRKLNPPLGFPVNYSQVSYEA